MHRLNGWSVGAHVAVQEREIAIGLKVVCFFFFGKQRTFITNHDDDVFYLFLQIKYKLRSLRRNY
jgi:hypothetical protein